MLFKEVLGVHSGWKAWHEPPMCTCSPEGQPCPWLHQQKCGQQIKGGDSVPPIQLWWDPTWSTASNSGAPNPRRTWSCWSSSRGGLQRWSKGWSTSPMKKGQGSWGCSAWSREGCRETLEQPSSTWRGPTRKMGKIFSAGLAAIRQGVMALN